MAVSGKNYRASDPLPWEISPMTAGSTLGQRIRAAYIGAGLNRSQFSRMMDVHYTTVISWEKDKTRPRADSLRMIAEITNTPVAALLDGQPTRAASTPALAAFLKTPQGRSVSDDELRMLQSMRAYGGRFTELTYQTMLMAIRQSMEPEGNND